MHQGDMGETDTVASPCQSMSLSVSAAPYPSKQTHWQCVACPLYQGMLWKHTRSRMIGAALQGHMEPIHSGCEALHLQILQEGMCQGRPIQLLKPRLLSKNGLPSAFNSTSLGGTMPLTPPGASYCKLLKPPSEWLLLCCYLSMVDSFALR